MKPRIAVVFVLSLGLLMSGTGATLAVISDSDSAGKVQYPDLGGTEGKGEPGDVLGGEETSPTGGGQPDGQPGGGEQGASEESGGAGDAPVVQEERQVASSGGGELPFTGFLAIPLLIAGVMLLVAGGVMRSRTRAGTDR